MVYIGFMSLISVLLDLLLYNLTFVVVCGNGGDGGGSGRDVYAMATVVEDVALVLEAGKCLACCPSISTWCWSGFRPGAVLALYAKICLLCIF